MNYNENSYELWVSMTCPIQFMNTVVELAAKGAKMKEGAFPNIKRIPYSCKMVGSTPITKKSYLTTPIIGVTEIPTLKFYNEEMLEQLSWEDFKVACKVVGITGRDRNQMTREYLAKTKQQEEELKKPQQARAKKAEK